MFQKVIYWMAFVYCLKESYTQRFNEKMRNVVYMDPYHESVIEIVALILLFDIMIGEAYTICFVLFYFYMSKPLTYHFLAVSQPQSLPW